VVENNRPVATKIVEEQHHITGLTWDYIEHNRRNGEMVTTEYSVFDSTDTTKDNHTFYSFEFSNGKK
jgi:hypothetical protein